MTTRERSNKTPRRNSIWTRTQMKNRARLKSSRKTHKRNRLLREWRRKMTLSLTKITNSLNKLEKCF